MRFTRETMPKDTKTPGTTAGAALVQLWAKLWRHYRSFTRTPDKLSWVGRRLSRRKLFRRAWEEFERELPRQQQINLQFDQRYGTETADETALVETGVSANAAERGNGVYRPLWESAFFEALAQLDIDFHGFTFVDVGSGKGKLLLLASDYPFKKIIGLEYAPQLHEIATRNIEKYRKHAKRCEDIVSVHADALDYEWPAGPIVGLIFNSFDPDTMYDVAKRFDAELSGRAEPVYLIYSNLRHIEEIDEGLCSFKRMREFQRTSKQVIFTNDAGFQSRARAHC